MSCVYIARGYNFNGQLGRGDTSDSNTPASVTGLSSVVQMDAGRRGTCALLADNSVRCWGQNDHGELGIGTTTTSATSVPAAAIVFPSSSPSPSATPTPRAAVPVTSICGNYGSNCALMSAGTVTCWGWNQNGQLGNGNTGTSALVPGYVTGINTATGVDCGHGWTSCALLSDTTVKCW